MLQRTLDVYQIAIPVPLPLKFVNCYVARGEEGWDLLDTGMDHPICRQTWQEAFLRLELRPQELRRIYVSHMHTDHLGLAHWFQEQSGAPVYLLDHEQAQLTVWADPQRLSRMRTEFYGRHGMPPAVVDEVMVAMAELRHMADSPLALIELLHPGDRIRFGTHSCQVIWTPGHSDGMYCLYDAEAELLWAADHVLPRISPNISLWPANRPDPLADYLASLELVRRLPVRRVLPGHGPVFNDLQARVDELVHHHGERLGLMLGLTGDGQTAYAIARQVFRNDLTGYEIQFAMAETLAHLEYLAYRGAVQRIEHKGEQLYRAA